jgi:molecular chaperone DnaK
MKRKDRRVGVRGKDGHSKGDVVITGKGIKGTYTGSPTEFTAMSFVYLVVDCSSSMGGSNIIQAKTGAMEFAKEAVKKGYSIGLISFDSEAQLLSAPRRQLSEIQEHVNALRAEGSTNMSDAIDLAATRLGTTGVRVMVLVTDGEPDSVSAAEKAASRAKAKGIDIIAVGTDEADYDFLKRIASRKNLATMVGHEQLKKGIADTAGMLPSG